MKTIDSSRRHGATRGRCGRPCPAHAWSLLCIAAFVLPAGAATPAPEQPFRAAYLPAADGEILQQVPAASDPKVREMRSLRGRLDADPRNLGLASRLADAYIDFGRQVGDAHYAGYAEAVIAPWLAQQAPPATMQVTYATILQYRHQFDEARAQLGRALQRDAENGQAWLTLATLDMVQGNHAAASRGCAQAASMAGYAYGVACAATLRSYMGQAQQAITMVAVITSDSTNLPVPFRSWTEGLLAECAERLGHWSEAEAHYRRALSSTPEDNFLRVAYADFLLDRQRPQDVLKLLGTDTASDTAFLRIVLAQAALKSPDLARYVWIMSARFEALAQRGSDFFGREQVRFALHLQHDADGALQLAEQNWAAQREPWDARVLLEAALAANRPDAAAPVLAFIERSKLQDPVIDTLAGQLRAAHPKASGDAQ